MNHTGRMIIWNKIGLACGKCLLYFLVVAGNFVFRDYFRKRNGGWEIDKKAHLLILPMLTAK